MKHYVTYTRKNINDNFFSDPNTDWAVEKQTQGLITFNETPYEINGVFISLIEYDTSSINLQELEYFRTLDPDFNFTIVEEDEVNKLLSTLWDVSVKDFIFTDNRPID